MAETAEFKETRKLYARLLKNYLPWKSLVESEGLHTLTLRGKEFHYLDILEGFNVLPPRQRLAVWLMCVEDKSEAEVAERMGFTKWPTPVQQYKNFGLARLIEFNEASPEKKKQMLEKAKKYRKKDEDE